MDIVANIKPISVFIMDREDPVLRNEVRKEEVFRGNEVEDGTTIAGRMVDVIRDSS